MTENCPTCNRPLPETITVEQANGVHDTTYWTGQDYNGKTAMRAAQDRIHHLKERWNITARIRERA